MNPLTMDMKSNMTVQDRLDLNRLLSEAQAVDNTQIIRETKASGPLIECIKSLESLKQKNRGLKDMDYEQFVELCKTECAYYYTNYTDIFNRQLKDELNLAIMIRFIRVLELIEQGQIDQHEGSVMVGKYLKELYVDSALRRSDHLEEEHPPEPKKEPVRNVSWRSFKQDGKPTFAPH